MRTTDEIIAECDKIQAMARQSQAKLESGRYDSNEPVAAAFISGAGCALLWLITANDQDCCQPNVKRLENEGKVITTNGIQTCFPKIWHVGSKEAENLLRGPVEVTEKVDGSQFAFGLDELGVLHMRSKGSRLFHPTEDKLFKPVVDWVQTLLPRSDFQGCKGHTYYGETLAKPRHNTINYERTPLSHFVLFGCRRPDGSWVDSHDDLRLISIFLGCDVAPLLYQGELNLEKMKELMVAKSYLGGDTIEGVVIKNYGQLAVSAYSRECFAKHVRESFREANGMNFPSKKDSTEAFYEQFRTEARWRKAIQHLREASQLTDSPKDIGSLLIEIQNDLKEEETQNIKEALFKMHINNICRAAIRGFPDFYKQKLLEKQFESQEEGEGSPVVVGGSSNESHTVQEAPLKEAV